MAKALRKKPIKPLPRGIRRHGAGYQVRVSVAGADRSCTQFPLDATLEEMQAWQEDEDYRLRLIARKNPKHQPRPQAGTFADDARKYLRAVAAMPDIKNRKRDIALWVAEFGGRRRHKIAASDVRAVRDRWLTVGPKRVYRKATEDEPGHWADVATPLAGSTVNHRLRALSNLWTVLDGRRAPNPVREVPEADEAPELPRAIDYGLVEQILAALPDRGPGERDKKRSTLSKTKARLRVMAWTGLPPAMVKKLKAKHVDLKGATLTIEGRKKGKGAPAIRLPLLPEAVEAFKALEAAGGWGPFSTSSVRASFNRAVKKVCTLTGLRPYDLRHSFGSRVFLTTGNLNATGDLLVHADKRTTRRYTLAAANPVLTAALGQWRVGQPNGTKEGSATE